MKSPENEEEGELSCIFLSGYIGLVGGVVSCESIPSPKVAPRRDERSRDQGIKGFH